MNKDFLASLAKATALTRAGDLAQATALIQRQLHGAANLHERGAADVIDVVPSDTAKPQPQAAANFFRKWQRDNFVDVETVADTMDKTPAGQQGQFIAGSYAASAGERSYKLHVPDHQADEALPLIVMLHGCKQTPDDFALGTQMNVVANQRRCFVLYPAQANSANASRCWNWFRREDQVRDQGEPSIIAGMTREVASRYRIDSGKVFIAGLSAGGAMAAVMAVTYPELFAAVGIHSGLACGSAQDLPSALAAMRGMPTRVARAGVANVMPTIVFHGDKDKTVHPRNGDQVVSQSVDSRGPASATTCERGQVAGGHSYTRTLHRDAGGQVMLEHWLVHGGGHAWFGGSARGSYTDPRGPNAADEMARFFLQTR
jgi:poly(hydroxyalkanoate) depolymerase family esterase